MENLVNTDAGIRDVLETVKVIALVGASPKPDRPSYGVMKFLLDHGYRVIPVNPGQVGKSIHGQDVVARLADITEPVDMIDVFRASAEVPGVVEEALAMTPHPKVIWMQLGISHEEAAARAASNGIKVVQNHCPAIEYPRLIGG